MKTIVIYNSQTGFTKQYAQWISKKTGAECVALNKAKKMDLSGFDTIAFGSWMMAESVNKFKWFKKNVSKWQGKKLLVFCVGASPAENPDLDKMLSKYTDDEALRGVEFFYCPGGLRYEKMPSVHRVMMRMFLKMLGSKKDKTPEDVAQIEMISNSFDGSDIKYAEPVAEYINR